MTVRIFYFGVIYFMLSGVGLADMDAGTTPGPAAQAGGVLFLAACVVVVLWRPVSAFFRGFKKKEKPVDITPEILCGEGRFRVIIPGVHPAWPEMWAGQDNLNIDGWGCVNPNVYARRHAIMVPIFWLALVFFVILGFAVSGNAPTQDGKYMGFVVFGSPAVLFGWFIWRAWHGDRLYKLVRNKWPTPLRVGLWPDRIEFSRECTDQTEIRRQPGARLVASMKPLDEATVQRDMMGLSRDRGHLKKYILRTMIYRQSARIYVSYGDYDTRVLGDVFNIDLAMQLMNGINGAEAAYLAYLQARGEKSLHNLR